MAAVRAPQDRKPRARKSTAAELAVAEPAPAERVAAEAEMLDDTREWAPTELPNGETIRIMPMAAWPRAVYAAVANGGNFEVLARVIHEDDLEVWTDWDCPVGELMEFTVGLIIDGGQEVGESVASKRSSRSTRRR